MRRPSGLENTPPGSYHQQGNAAKPLLRESRSSDRPTQTTTGKRGHSPEHRRSRCTHPHSGPGFRNVSEITTPRGSMVHRPHAKTRRREGDKRKSELACCSLPFFLSSSPFLRASAPSRETFEQLPRTATDFLDARTAFRAEPRGFVILRRVHHDTVSGRVPGTVSAWLHTEFATRPCAARRPPDEAPWSLWNFWSFC